jgi:hypothetical protein
VLGHLRAGVPEHRQVPVAPAIRAGRYHVGIVNRIRHIRIISRDAAEAAGAQGYRLAAARA